MGGRGSGGVRGNSYSQPRITGEYKYTKDMEALALEGFKDAQKNVLFSTGRGG